MDIKHINKIALTDEDSVEIKLKKLEDQKKHNEVMEKIRKRLEDAWDEIDRETSNRLLLDSESEKGYQKSLRAWTKRDRQERQDLKRRALSIADTYYTIEQEQRRLERRRPRILVEDEDLDQYVEETNKRLGKIPSWIQEQ